MSDFKPEKLLAAHMLLKRTHERLPVDELIVKQALEDPHWEPDYVRSAIDTNAAFLTILRTGSIFLLDQDEAWPTLNSDAPELFEFPPLPYNRCWIELQDTQEKAVSFMRFNSKVSEDEVSPLVILGVGLVEIIQGQVWDLLTPFAVLRDETSLPPLFSVIGHRLTPRGFTGEDLEYTQQALGEAAAQAQQKILSMAVSAAHLIVADAVPHHEIVLPRSQRRRMEREYPAWAKQTKPRIYYVNLKLAGEKRKHNQGGVAGYREYHCRWLVRGHWRQYPDETRMVNGKPIHWTGKRAWIKPYVKGPIGAPWRGRPIYRDKKKKAS